jgi:hypothetical protein
LLEVEGEEEEVVEEVEEVMQGNVLYILIFKKITT